MAMGVLEVYVGKLTQTMKLVSKKLFIVFHQ